MDGELQTLAGLIRRRNEVAREITAVIQRPAQIGHIGEFIASRVFDIELEASAGEVMVTTGALFAFTVIVMASEPGAAWLSVTEAVIT